MVPTCLELHIYLWQDRQRKNTSKICLSHVEIAPILFPLQGQAQMPPSSCNISFPISLLNWTINFCLLWDTADLCVKLSRDAFHVTFGVIGGGEHVHCVHWR